MQIVRVLRTKLHHLHAIWGKKRSILCKAKATEPSAEPGGERQTVGYRHEGCRAHHQMPFDCGPEATYNS